MLELDYELNELLETLQDESITRVLIQLPDGLKPHGGKISEKIREVRPNITLHSVSYTHLTLPTICSV